MSMVLTIIISLAVLGVLFCNSIFLIEKKNCYNFPFAFLKLPNTSMKILISIPRKKKSIIVKKKLFKVGYNCRFAP